MFFISEITAFFRTLTISVSIDPALLPHLDCEDKVTTPRDVRFNLYDLIYYTGTIQTRRFATSNRQKYLDKSDLVEKIQRNSADFRIRLSDIRAQLSPEDLTSICEDFGVGISVVIAVNLFNIRHSTIESIGRTRKRPDWKCQTIGNRILIVEAKGSSSAATSATQQPGALIQKNSEPGDVHIASLTVFYENQISENRFLDPPGNENNMDAESQNRILRAGHYAAVMSFLGHSAFSRYFTQMKKRLESSITAAEQSLKDNTYNEITTRYSRVLFRDRSYAGTFYKINNEKFLFIGIDIELVSFQGFLSFQEYSEDVDEQVSGNHYILYRDGILIIEIREINAFRQVTEVSQIKNYQDYNTISDIDEMTTISFERYIHFLLAEIGAVVNNNQSSAGLPDLSVAIGNRQFIFELKIFKNWRHSQRQVTETLTNLTRTGNLNYVLITNAQLPSDFIAQWQETIIISRSQLKEIIRSPTRLSSYLGV